MANLSYLLLSRCRCDMRIIPARAGFTPAGRVLAGRRGVGGGPLRCPGPRLACCGPPPAGGPPGRCWHPRTSRPWAKGDERSRLARLLADAGLPHMTAYGLMRTSFVTLVLTAGVPERDVMIGARHTSARGPPTTTASTARSSAP